MNKSFPPLRHFWPEVFWCFDHSSRSVSGACTKLKGKQMKIPLVLWDTSISIRHCKAKATKRSIRPKAALAETLVLVTIVTLSADSRQVSGRAGGALNC